MPSRPSSGEQEFEDGCICTWMNAKHGRQLQVRVRAFHPDKNVYYVQTRMGTGFETTPAQLTRTPNPMGLRPLSKP